jgi:hypothetical protein
LDEALPRARSWVWQRSFDERIDQPRQAEPRITLQKFPR